MRTKTQHITEEMRELAAAIVALHAESRVHFSAQGDEEFESDRMLHDKAIDRINAQIFEKGLILAYRLEGVESGMMLESETSDG